MVQHVRDVQPDIFSATNLKGRGIDVPTVGLVVNFDMSSTLEASFHHICQSIEGIMTALAAVSQTQTISVAVLRLFGTCWQVLSGARVDRYVECDL